MMDVKDPAARRQTDAENQPQPRDRNDCRQNQCHLNLFTSFINLCSIVLHYVSDLQEL